MRLINRLPRPLTTLAALPVAVAILLLAFTGAHAQFGQGFRTSATLTKSDIKLIRKIVRKDLVGKPKGTSLPWKNPDSGNSGKVTLLDSFPSEGRACSRVRYFIDPGPNQPAAAQPTTYVITSCKYADGSWKQDNGAQPDKPK